MKVYFSNSGCTMEAEDFLRFLYLTGAEQTNEIIAADIIIAHFCALSTESFKSIPQHMAVLKGLKDLNPNLKLYIGGCASEVLDLKKRYPFVDGFFNRRNMVEDLSKYFGYAPKSDENPPISYYNCIRIQSGCARHCGFCKKAYLKMPLNSKPIENVIADIKNSVKNGYHDILLLAENSTEYGMDLPGNIRLIDLLKAIVQIDGIASLFITALCIDELALDSELVDFIKGCNKIHKLQLEIQSLIPEVRKNMLLSSTVEDVLRILGEFSNKYIITNIMLGYPGETDDNFRRQLELIEKYGLYYVQANTYDDTPLVYGHSLKKIPNKIVNERISQLINTLIRIRNQKAVEIQNKSKVTPIQCIYTSNRTFETIGYSAVVEVANSKAYTSGQIINVEITGIKRSLDMLDINQNFVLKGVRI